MCGGKFGQVAKLSACALRRTRRRYVDALELCGR
jgi:hypothetical protein